MTTPVIWRRMTLRYAWIVMTRELARSRRWSIENRLSLLAAIGVIYSAKALPITTIAYLSWLLTGRGPWRRYGYSEGIVVDPFSTALPPDVLAALGELNGPARRPWFSPASIIRVISERAHRRGAVRCPARRVR